MDHRGTEERWSGRGWRFWSDGWEEKQLVSILVSSGYRKP